MEIIKITEGPEVFSDCLIRTERCSSHAPCSLHDKISPYRNGLSKVLQTETIADIVSEFRQDSERIRI